MFCQCATVECVGNTCWVFFFTYSQSSGASSSLISRLARLALKDIKSSLNTGYDKLKDIRSPPSLGFIPTYRRSLGSGEANVSWLASRSSWAGRSSAAVLSSRTLEDGTGSIC